MSINVENNLKSSEPSLGTVHYLPFKIDGDGEANVEKYFNPYIKTSQNGAMTASFRGYPLSGNKLPMPAGHTLTLLTEGKTPLGSKTDRNFKVKGHANTEDVVYWNWDTKPSQNDPFHKATKWIAIAEALHAPLNLEE